MTDNVSQDPTNRVLLRSAFGVRVPDGVPPKTVLTCANVQLSMESAPPDPRLTATVAATTWALDGRSTSMTLASTQPHHPARRPSPRADRDSLGSVRVADGVPPGDLGLPQKARVLSY